MRPTGCGSPRRLGANPAPENRRDLRAARTTHKRERGFFLRSRWMTWFREQGRAFSLKPPLQCHSRLRVWLWWCVSSVSCYRWPGLLLPFCRSLLFLVIKFLVICSGQVPDLGRHPLRYLHDTQFGASLLPRGTVFHNNHGARSGNLQFVPNFPYVATFVRVVVSKAAVRSAIFCTT